MGEQSPCFPQMDACLGHSLITQWRAMDFVSNLARGLFASACVDGLNLTSTAGSM